MSSSNTDLMLHLRLDEVQNKQVADASGNALHGTVQGNPGLVPDETFGTCLNFDGNSDYLALPPINVDFSRGFTVEAWVFYLSFNDSSAIIDLGNADGANNIFLGNVGTTGNLSFQLSQANADHTLEAAGALSLNEWKHVAVTVDKSGNAIIYIDGQPSAGGALQLPESVERSDNYVAKSNATGARNFQGKLANVRLYSRALSPEEIGRDMEEDQTAMAAFRVSYPIDFQLFDDNFQPIIYIEDGSAGERLHIEITNTGRQPVELAAPPGGSIAAQSNHHFEVCLRPGTLSEATLRRIALLESGASAGEAQSLEITSGKTANVPAGTWSIARGQTVDGTTSVYFLNLTGRSLDHGEKITLTLPNVSADGTGGARSTRVELKYQQMTYAGETNLLSGSRVQHLSIVNQQGKKSIPLHVGFVGSNTILNDGAAVNSLSLRITNILKGEAISLNPSDSDAPSRFIISFDAADAQIQEEWALGTLSQVVNIEIDAPGWQVNKETQGQSPHWTLVNQSKTELAPGEAIQLNLSNIITSLPSGNTNLYVQYENIPGYWDGQFVSSIEKAPIVYRGSNVGIWTANPRSALDTDKGVMTGAANDYEKAQFTMSGGGTVTWEGPGGRLNWTNRFVALPVGNPKTSSDGFININVPDKDLPAAQVFDGTPRSVNEAGILLNGWEALYAVHTVGGGADDVQLHLVDFRREFTLPSNWLLVALVNAEDKTVKLGTGVIVTSKSSSAYGSGLPCGTILMWSGSVADIPEGWGLCDATPGRVDLRDKFIVGAGGAYKPKDQGGQDTVTLDVTNMPNHRHSLTILEAGNHAHEMLFDTGSGGSAGTTEWMAKTSSGKQNWVDANYSVMTQKGGGHTHGGSIEYTGGGLPFDTLPPYYALCFIMKLY